MAIVRKLTVAILCASFINGSLAGFIDDNDTEDSSHKIPHGIKGAEQEAVTIPGASIRCVKAFQKALISWQATNRYAVRTFLLGGSLFSLRFFAKDFMRSRVLHRRLSAFVGGGLMTLGGGSVLFNTRQTTLWRDFHNDKMCRDLLVKAALDFNEQRENQHSDLQLRIEALRKQGIVVPPITAKRRGRPGHINSLWIVGCQVICHGPLLLGSKGVVDYSGDKSFS